MVCGGENGYTHQIGPPITGRLLFPFHPTDSINGQNDIDLSTNELNEQGSWGKWARNGFKLWFSRATLLHC